MTRRKVDPRSLARSTESLYRAVRSILEAAREGTYRAVNMAMVAA